MHTLMEQMLKEVAGGRAGSGKEDALMAAILAKVGQPDPLVLKWLDTHGKREELNDFFKVQAESMRMASTLQTDSLKQVMVASQKCRDNSCVRPPRSRRSVMAVMVGLASVRCCRPRPVLLQHFVPIIPIVRPSHRCRLPP